MTKRITWRAKRRRAQQKARWLRVGAVLAALVLVAGLWFWASRPRGYRIALDPGHGGDDPGAVGLIAETDLTETTVRYLEELLRADDNYSVILCRDYGEGASSGERGRKATRKGADLLLSVHGNSAADPTAQGFECYPQLPSSATYQGSLRFAQLLGEEMAAAGAVLRGEAGVRYAVYNAEGQKQILNSADGVAGSTFGVLEQADCPAVLAEQCFLTSAEDVAAFAGEEGCARAAEAYYRAICRYFSTTPQL